MSGESHSEREAISAVAGLLAKLAVKEPMARQLLDVYRRLGEQGLREIMEAFEGIVAERARELAESSTGEATEAEPCVEPVKLNVDPSELFEKPEEPAPGVEAVGSEAVSTGEELRPGEAVPAVPETPGTSDADRLDLHPHFEPTGPLGARLQQLRIPFQYDDDDIVYLHGVTVVPVDERSESRPFMLEEKGLDSREFAFALDRRGLRFFLSRVDRRLVSISKAGQLLSGKQESLRLRGVHESVLNDLRAHGVVLPFEFGTVVRSKGELLALIDAHFFDLHDAVDDLLATSWWKLTVAMLDSRLASIIGSEPGFKDRERRLPSRSTAPARKLDIKMLEKILGRQKRIAESVHHELEKVADRAEVEMMIGFSSGTSDDWKPILRASYLVPPSRVQKLHRAITDIQYRHLLFELMLALQGDQAAFAFHTER